MKSIPALLIAVFSGVLVLLGIFFPNPLFLNMKSILLNIVMILGSFALIIAIINLISVHWNKIFSIPGQGIYSAILLAGFLCVVFTGLIFGAENPFFVSFSSTVIFTIESSLFALLCISLSIACFKLFQKRQNGMGIIFAISTIVFLLVLSGFIANESQFPAAKLFLSIINELPVAGARGILLGVSIGAIVTGIRVLIGLDRPYNG